MSDKFQVPRGLGGDKYQTRNYENNIYYHTYIKDI